MLKKWIVKDLKIEFFLNNTPVRSFWIMTFQQTHFYFSNNACWNYHPLFKRPGCLSQVLLPPAIFDTFYIAFLVLENIFTGNVGKAGTT